MKAAGGGGDPDGGHELLRSRDAWAYTLQARREELTETVQSLARMVELMTTEQAQLRAERDTLADCVRSLQELQQQPPQPKEIRPQVSQVT